jgi:exopolyphosphatase / guanosine-5'-triphosphate,3'-diphosphate pyrophosphatase
MAGDEDQSPLAALDIGSNTVRLLVAVPDGCELHTLLDLSSFARLGSGVDQTGLLDPDRQDRAAETVREFTDAARAQGVEQVLAVATSAVRDARNGPEFAARLREEAGVDVQIATGEEEARLTFLGATLGMSPSEEMLVIDIGGGSGEIIAAKSRQISWGQSLPIGGGRLTERFVRHDPPEMKELQTLDAHVRRLLEKLPPARPKKLVGTGGTAKHIPILLGLEGAPSELVPDQLQQALRVLTSSRHGEVAERFGIEPARAPVLPAGVQTIQSICDFYGVECLTITMNGIRQGMIIDELLKEGRWPCLDSA